MPNAAGWRKPRPRPARRPSETSRTPAKRGPKLDRALYYRGVLLKRANRLDEALRDFKAAVDVNPKNMDAVREVRLHTLRAGDKGDKKRLLGKLFGK